MVGCTQRLATNLATPQCMELGHQPYPRLAKRSEAVGRLHMRVVVPLDIRLVLRWGIRLGGSLHFAWQPWW